ncbi:MAG: branched-chain-amino-acid transaminase [Gemmataceae bacterium]
MAAIYLNGKIVDRSEAKVSVYDHGFLYGDGVFEGIRVYSGKVFRHREHIDRLYDSGRAIALEIPMPREQMIAAVEQTVKAYGKPDGYIRLVVSRGPGNLGLDPRKCEPQIIIIVDDIALYPPELYTTGLEIITASTIRNHPNAVNPRVKSLNYLNNILAKIEGIRAGCLEALMLNTKGEVAECTGDNIFVVKRGELKTPPTDAGILEGITRDAVLQLARAAGIPAAETALTRHDVYVADEVFLTGTAAEVIPVVKIDGRIIGTGKPGPLTRQLRERFQKLVRE